MANLKRNFTAGKMNKVVDERLIPNGQYIDGLNIRMGSTEAAEIGVIENTKGNNQLTNIVYANEPLSETARCIGAFEDGVNETIYWFIHDDDFNASPTDKLDLIISYNTKTEITTYHVISINDGSGTDTTLNFDPRFLITGVDKVGDLLFFTDNINQPRRINVKKNYVDPIGLVDGFSDEDILVIKKPPVAAPSLLLSTTGGEENFLEERFICFGYRYRYEDNEYSATSQFTSPAFIPNNFDFTQESYLNEGMTNTFNTAVITFNTGGPLVKGIDLLFKDANSPVIKIIEKLTKEDNGYNDYQDASYTFKNSKIFTILPEAEILRLYDNVPRLSKAQTIMGNRLMYGNYVEGYDLVDHTGSPVRLDFTVQQKNESLNESEILGSLEERNYYIQVGTDVPDASAVFDLTNLYPFDNGLREGALISFSFEWEHYTWTGSNPQPQDINQPPIQLSFSIQLTKDYSSVYEWVNSPEFVDLIGTDTSQPIATIDNGTTMTDVFIQQFDDTISGGPSGLLLIYDYGINTPQSQPSVVGSGIRAFSFPTSNLIYFEFPAVQYVDSNVSTEIYTEYFSLKTAEVSYIRAGNSDSLHSNRGYEVGMIYMDEYNRATTALVSQHNTQHVPCSKSSTKNSLQVTIPSSQIAPGWATRYKLAIKPDKETYDTIFTNIYFTDPDTSDTYFLLEGENSAKITDGQRLIVKADSRGPARSCIYATVLDKSAQAADFINPVDDDGNELAALAGTYMKIKADNFSVESSIDAIVATGTKTDTATSGGGFPKLFFRMVNGDGSAGNPYTAWDIPGGSRIVLNFTFTRVGTGDGNQDCERRIYTLEKTLVASQSYDSFYQWFEGDNVQNVLDQGIPDIGGGGTVQNDYIGTVTTPPGFTFDGPPFPTTGVNYWCFGNERSIETNSGVVTEPITFSMSGTNSCNGSGPKRDSSISGSITVYRAENLLIFESEPLDSAPDIWYESEKSFGIINTDGFCFYNISVASSETNSIVIDYLDDSLSPAQISIAPGTTEFAIVAKCGSPAINSTTPPLSPANVTGLNTPISIPKGTHLGDVQDQQLLNTPLPAIADTGFYNCYAFGNGCESYKIRDGVIGKDFTLGNRVTSTNSVDYKEVRRFADITYSGIYNDESNVNKLNEFNGGLLNFKPLEESFGPIQLLFARETDVLTLQEDKISYVLSGKNLLSDAGTGNLLQSVPEVLGTQIARIEEYGISFNPESFSQWGPDKYFSDAKRGAVLKLTGTSYSNDSLEVVSKLDMRSWFRDLFITSFETQKLGGFDPYMNEYVLSSNTINIPVSTECVSCGVKQDITFFEPYKQCFNFGSNIGDVDIKFTGVSASSVFTVVITYNGQTYSQTIVGTNGTITFPKDVVNVTDATIELIPGPGVTEPITLTLGVPCPDAKVITLIEVCVTTPNEGGLTTHNEHRFVDGSYTSPIQSTEVQFGLGSSQPVVSYYNSVTGYLGSGSIPTVGSNVTLAFNKFAQDTASFAPSNKFMWLVSSVNYPNTQAAVESLLNAAVPMSTNSAGAPDYYTGTFTMPPVQDGEYLYLIYDYRKPSLVDLCVGSSLINACCLCDL